MSTGAWFHTDGVHSGRTPSDLAVPEPAQAVLDIRGQGRIGGKPHVPAQVLFPLSSIIFGEWLQRISSP